MRIKYFIIIILMGTLTSSCEMDELFEREQYKKVFALLSDNAGFNIFAEEHNLELTASPGAISATCGGSLPTEKDLNIAIVEDEDLLLSYNTRNFGEETGKYALRLPRTNYDIASYNIKIPAGERGGVMPISINANGLSPDSVYLLPLSVSKFSSYEMNPDKRTVLYRVYMKNYYATNKSEIYYNSRAKRKGADSIDTNLIGIKRVFPLRGNSVRTLAGNLSTIDIGSMVLTVDENNKVKITSWKYLDITQIDGDPDYPNTFSIFDDGYTKYKTFLLRYNYIYIDQEYEMREELRVELEEELNY